MDTERLKELAARRAGLKLEEKLLNQKLRETKKQLDEVEDEMLAIMGDVERITIGDYDIRLKDKEFIEVEDFDAFWNFIKENDAPYLMQRRPSLTAIREAFMMGEDVPGVKLKTVKKIA